MRIITISRQFGSGGRELGKRLADALGIPCYDHEIIDKVVEQHGFDKIMSPIFQKRTFVCFIHQL